MVLELPEIFRCYQIDLGDWLLFDATEPMSEEEIKCFETPVPSSTVPLNIKSDLLKLLESKGVGIFLEDITPSYYVSFFFFKFSMLNGNSNLFFFFFFLF